LEIEIVFWRDQQNQRKVALVSEGRRWLHVVTMEGGPLTVRKVAPEERRFMTPLLVEQEVERVGKKVTVTGGRPYSPRRAAWHFREYAKAHGSTLKADEFLKELKQQNPRGG